MQGHCSNSATDGVQDATQGSVQQNVVSLVTLGIDPCCSDAVMHPSPSLQLFHHAGKHTDKQQQPVHLGTHKTTLHRSAGESLQTEQD